MRTNIDIDDQLLAEAMKISGHKTKKAVVEDSLRQFITRDRRRRALESLAGIGWEGDLDAMREGWTLEQK